MQFYRPLFRETGITERQWRVLRNLYDEPYLEPSELAVRAYMQAPNVSRVLSELLKLGWIERVASGEDQRRSRITLTDDGRDATIRIGRQIEIRTAELFATEEADDFRRLGPLLEVVADLPAKYPHLTRGNA
ncbi:MAG: MarR family transcriptional regulator [Pseudomonadota bacterium]|nr:MarR family transcriptional regulator [Pseudomonadota bacterium]